jgi:pimeloyl-ACP methyl ester carboxylesterase
MKTKKWLWVGGTIPLVLGLAGLIIYFGFPQVLLGMVRWGYERNARATAKQIVVDGYPISYYEGGKENAPKLILIHGFGDSKISFLQVAKWLTKEYRVLMPEVPGFGTSPHDPKRRYGIASQVAIFHKMFEKLGYKRFALGGNSMGGHIAAAYTLKYPKEVSKLLLLNAAGVKAPKTGIPYAPGRHPMKTTEDFLAFLKKCFYKLPSIPRPVLSHLTKQALKSAKWNQKIGNDIRTGGDYLLNAKIGSITTPTLVLWGDHDQIVDPAIGKVYHANIKGSKWVMMKKCGHLPQNERPRETAQHMLSFLK